MHLRHGDHAVDAGRGDRLDHAPLVDVEDQELARVHVRDVQPARGRVEARVVEAVARPGSATFATSFSGNGGPESWRLTAAAATAPATARITITARALTRPFLTLAPCPRHPRLQYPLGYGARMELVQTRRLGSREARKAAIDAGSRAATAWRSPAQRRLIVALASAFLAALAFARIAEDYLTNDPLARWDVRFAHWLALKRSDLGTEFFRVITFLGSPAFALAVSAVVCVVLYRRRLLVQAALLPLVLAGAEFLNLALKLAFHRPRPEVAFVSIDTYSFPSGHAMVSSAAYGALAYIAWPYLRSSRQRVLLLVGTAVFVGLICFSRLYLGVHYLSDVLAGAAGGVFWLSVSVAVLTIWGERLASWFAGTRADGIGRRITRV